jgi:G2/mitotic-specific cyclin-B2
MQLKKTTTKFTSSIKSEPELQLIKSPGRALKKEKVGQVQKNYYESHSSKMLHQVENIDENDVDNPQMLPEYVNDIYAYLFKLEAAFPIRENFLANQMDVTPKMRSVLLDWINEVHHQFSLEVETYHMAVSIIDRYLQINTTTPRRYLQLVGATALFTASKFEELMPPEITDFIYVTDDTYSKEQMLSMEKKIFKTLGYNLSKPLSIHFLRRFAKAAGPLGDRQYTAAKYFMELATVDYELTKQSPSMVSFEVFFELLKLLINLKFHRSPLHRSTSRSTS